MRFCIISIGGAEGDVLPPARDNASMGIYVNPGHEGFRQIRRGRYVDKSGLIRLVNEKIETPDKLICVSRPRRFGKSFAAKMLCAYYDRSCDSDVLFSDLEISTDASYRDYLNHFDVIYIDMTNILGKAGSIGLLPFIEQAVTEELGSIYPGAPRGRTFDETLLHVAEHTGTKFVIIIDEWDAPIREAPAIQKEYLSFLRMLFKGSGTTDRIIAAAYMTGILPIKKDGSQSAVSDFREYTMIRPQRFGRYVGFTEDEVMELCREYEISYTSMKQWYDGYTFKDVGSVYNPNSVMQAIENREFDSCSVKTEIRDDKRNMLDVQEAE